MSAPDTLENTEKPLFKVDLGTEAGTLQPRSLDELAQWLQVEQEFWAWLARPPVANSVPDVQRQLHNQPLLVQRLTEARAFQQRADPANLSRVLADIQRILVERYAGMKLLHSSSPRAKYLASINDKISAAYAWRFFVGLGLSSPGNVIELRGFMLAATFDLGLSPERARSEENALRDLRKRVEDEHESLRSQAGKLADDFGGLHSNIVQLHEQQRKQHDEAQAARSTEFKTLVTDSENSLKKLKDESAAELKAIAETYDKKMSLQSAVTYLNDKAKTHRTVAWIMGLVSLAAAATFGGLAVWFGATLLGSDKTDWHRIATAALAATLSFWLLRILVRMFLSNMHLATDSRNRATLMQTYLALLREGGGLQADDRELILKMLFRPFTDGLVRDDATPPGLWDIATRLTGGK
jgi:hypothetical protein